MTDNIQRTDSVHKLTKNQFEWFRQVAADADLPSTASRVAIALTAYFNREHGGWAWMSQTTLAAELGVTERTIRDAMSALVARSHLVLQRRGKMETNKYRAAIKCESDRNETAGHDQQKSSDQEGVTGKFTSSDRKKSSKVTGRNLPPNPLNEPIEEPTEEIDSLSLDLGGEDSGRRDVQIPDTTDAEFEVWWVQYPRKVAKAAASRAYRAARKKATAEVLLNGAMRYAAERSGQDPRYTKHPATWFNGGCWSDEPAAAIGNGPALYAVPGGGRPNHMAVAEAMAREAQSRRLARG